jgi:NAD(P)-dependent dehydrogenase (short-subunit alcohol dehydrogenase family)
VSCRRWHYSHRGGRDVARGAEGVEAIKNLGAEAKFVAADLVRPEEIRRLARDVGNVDVLVNNAGRTMFAATDEVTPADFDSLLVTNVRARIYWSRHSHRLWVHVDGLHH